MPKRGPKPGKSSDFTEVVSAKVTPAMKRQIMLTVLRRKTEDASLPPRWGASDYIRDILIKYFKEHPDD